MKRRIKKVLGLSCTVCLAVAVAFVVTAAENKKVDVILEDNTSSVTSVQNTYVEYEPAVYARGEYQGLININTATEELLTGLDGIGKKTAEKIIEYRKTSNGFKSIEEIKNISGIGEKKFEKIKDRICVK